MPDDVFISYSRRDKEFVQQLVTRLEADKRDVWVDFEDIPFASDWWEEVRKGIESSRVFVFTISPHSLESDVCGLEINHAVQNRKRMIPILYREAKDIPLPSNISHLNWIDFSQEERFEEAVRKLLETVDTDLESNQRQTRLLLLAKEWEKHSHSNSLLLRGDGLAEMLPLAQKPDLTDLQRSFLDASQERSRRVGMIQRFESGFVGGLLGMGFWTFSVFRSNLLITPERIRWTIAMGGIFGIFIGLMALASEELPSRMQRSLSLRAQILLRAVLVVILGILAWVSYEWFLESIGSTSADLNALVFGGIGLAAGFVVRTRFQIPAWLAGLITAVMTWIPIYVTFERAAAGFDQFVPLIYFYDDPNQVFSIGIPMVLLIALGANFPAISREALGLYRHLRNQPHAHNPQRQG